MIYARRGQTIEPELDGAPTGLTGTIGVRLIDPPGGAVLIARTTAGITESAPGVYTATLTIPDTLPDESLLLVWDLGDPADPDETFTEELEVNATGTPVFPAAPEEAALLLLGLDGSTTPMALPTVADIGALLHARTYVNGVQIGTFNDDTRPTGDAVTRLVEIAAAGVATQIGEPVPVAYEQEARHLVVLQAATLIEASYFPEQLDSDQSAYRQYSAMFLSSRDALLARLREGGIASVPVGSMFVSPSSLLTYYDRFP